jgi:membrane associated rhomboid family serine protease
MLIPIGQEDSIVRRQPWVSYALLAINVLFFLVTSATGPGVAWRNAVVARIDEMVAYFNERPYLQLPPDLAALCDDKECQAAVEEQRKAFARKSAIPDDAVVAEQQRRLDEMGLALRTLRNKLPPRRFGYVPAEGKVDRALSSMFVHGGWVHLLGNMLFLWVTGPFVEDVFGRALFAVLYFLSGFAALATHVAKFPHSTVPLIGASGAIAGVMGAFLVRYARRKIHMLYMPFFPLLRPRFTFGVPAFVIAPLWFGEQFWYAHHAGTESGVAFWAHVGGFLFGAAFALAVRTARVEEKWIHPAIEKELTIEQDRGLERALDARVGGDLVRARREIAAVLTREPSNPDAWRESYDIACDGSDESELGRSGSRLVDLYARAGERDLALDLLRDLTARAKGPLPGRVFLSAGALFEKSGDWDLALEAYAGLVDRQPQDPAVVRALLRRAEILRRSGDAAAAHRALTQARAHPACVGATAQAVERALAAAPSPPRA